MKALLHFHDPEKQLQQLCRNSSGLWRLRQREEAVFAAADALLRSLRMAVNLYPCSQNHELNSCYRQRRSNNFQEEDSMLAPPSILLHSTSLDHDDQGETTNL